MKLSDVRRIIREEIEAAMVESTGGFTQADVDESLQIAVDLGMDMQNRDPLEVATDMVNYDERLGHLVDTDDNDPEFQELVGMVKAWQQKMMQSGFRVRVGEAAKPAKSKVIKENLGFETPRFPGFLPESYEQFRTAFKYAFEKMNLRQIAGRAMNLNESNSVLDGLERMWGTVEREMTGKLGMPAPAFKEGRDFWAYFAPELESDLARMVEANLQGSKLVKGNSIEVARAVLDVLKAGA